LNAGHAPEATVSLSRTGIPTLGLVDAKVGLADPHYPCVCEIIDVGPDVRYDPGGHVTVMLLQIGLQQVAEVGLATAMAEQQDPMGRRQGVRERFEVFVRLGAVDVEAAGWVAVVMEDIVVHVAGIGGHDLLRRCPGGRIDRVDSRMV